MEVNVNGFQNILELAWYYKVKKVVYASTSSMYAGHTLPFNEEMCIRPHTVYESSFHNRESVAFSYFHEYGVQSVGLRFFSIYGPNESHKKKYANNITQFLWDLQQDKRPKLYGDGKQARDFIHVNDVVEALKQAAFYDHELLKCNVVNVGTGISTSFNDIVKSLNKKMGKDIQPEYFTNPIPNYVYVTRADTNKAKHLLRWEPKVSLTDGIDKQIQHYGTN